jgi:hypothetical protein
MLSWVNLAEIKPLNWIYACEGIRLLAKNVFWSFRTPCAASDKIKPFSLNVALYFYILDNSNDDFNSLEAGIIIKSLAKILFARDLMTKQYWHIL